MHTFPSSGSLSLYIWPERKWSDATFVKAGEDLNIVIKGLDGIAREYTFEELVSLESDFVTQKGATTELSEKIIYHRALIGNQVILDTWEELGYRNGEAEKGAEDKVRRFLRPAPRDSKISKQQKKADYCDKPLTPILPNVDFRVFQNRLGWALSLDYDNTVLSFADWNDKDGIREIALASLDSEKTYLLLALTDPDAAVKLTELSNRHKEALDTYSHFKNRGLSEAVLAEQNKLLRDLRTSAHTLFRSANITQTTRFYEIIDPVNGLERIAVATHSEIRWRKSDLRLADIFRVINPLNQRRWRRQRNVIWEEFVLSIKELGYNAFPRRKGNTDLYSFDMADSGESIEEYNASPSYLRSSRVDGKSYLADI